MCLCSKESISSSEEFPCLNTSVEAYLEEMGPIVHLTGRNHPELWCHEI